MHDQGRIPILQVDHLAKGWGDVVGAVVRADRHLTDRVGVPADDEGSHVECPIQRHLSRQRVTKDDSMNLAPCPLRRVVALRISQLAHGTCQALFQQPVS